MSDMKKTVTCKYCSAEYPEELANCPYCGAEQPGNVPSSPG